MPRTYKKSDNFCRRVIGETLSYIDNTKDTICFRDENPLRKRSGLKFLLGHSENIEAHGAIMWETYAEVFIDNYTLKVDRCRGIITECYFTETR